MRQYKTLHFVKIVALVQGFFLKICIKFHHLLTLFRQKQKETVYHSENVTLCPNCRSDTGVFLDNLTKISPFAH